MFDLFGWLRRKAREAVLGGIADAVQEVAAGEPGADLERLRAVLAAEPRALAAAEPDEPRKGKGGGR